MFTAKYVNSDKVIDITLISEPLETLKKDGLVCRFCNEKVSIKAGELRAPHFFHLVKCTSNIQRHPESIEHLYGKRLIAEHVVRTWRYYSTAQIHYEFHIPEINRIADVALIFKSGFVVVHEIQLSPISIAELEKRTNDYERIGYSVYWWLGKSADSIYNRDWCQTRFGESRSIDYNRIRQLFNHHRS